MQIKIIQKCNPAAINISKQKEQFLLDQVAKKKVFA